MSLFGNLLGDVFCISVFYYVFAVCKQKFNQSKCVHLQGDANFFLNNEFIGTQKIKYCLKCGKKLK